MPRISRFQGLVIVMHFRDHAPPHFHVQRGEFEAKVDISTLEVMAGDLPIASLKLVRQWAAQHRDELAANWDHSMAHEPLDTIEPLP